MEAKEQEITSGRAAEPAALLAAYLEAGRSESAFVALVDRVAGLVLSSALRRTGNAALAEEVAQNVLAVLARKAAALRSHPNLSAWIFRTTQLESARAMRSEYRHTRKIAAFAFESGYPAPRPLPPVKPLTIPGRMRCPSWMRRWTASRNATARCSSPGISTGCVLMKSPHAPASPRPPAKCR
jgi:DNA-directed RNA polymerase specialized sigma24 family protein